VGQRFVPRHSLSTAAALVCVVVLLPTVVTIMLAASPAEGAWRSTSASPPPSPPGQGLASSTVLSTAVHAPPFEAAGETIPSGEQPPLRLSAGGAPGSAAVAATKKWRNTPQVGHPQGNLAGVSCPTATACVAVGWFVTPQGETVPLAEIWNGSAWTVKYPAIPSDLSIGNLYAVSCDSATSCMAVGSYITSSSKALTLAEVWNGTTWRIERSANAITGDDIQGLYGVSCPDPDTCTAVGYYVSPSDGDYATLAERWNGTTWAIESTPSVGGALFGVSCVTARVCIAVGSDFSSNGLAEGWNGITWTVQPTAPTGTFDAVSCVTATNCTGVGSEEVDGSNFALAEVFNGSTWTSENVPHPTGASASGFGGVSCTARNACTAVGILLPHVNTSGIVDSLPHAKPSRGVSR
jgi:hypothetical protein